MIHSPEVPPAEAVEIGALRLPGLLTVPPDAGGVVLFAHGSGSSRLSRRNQAVAAALVRAGFATLLFDLLSDEEAADRACVFDIPLLASRLSAAAVWVARQPRTAGLPLGYFGASTGAAAALVAATKPPTPAAVVSRGGRPDLAGAALAHVTAPTLLIVGGEDTEVLELNRAAASRLGAPHRVVVVPGATHLFEEPGALDQVAQLAADWFGRYLPAGAVRP